MLKINNKIDRYFKAFRQSINNFLFKILKKNVLQLRRKKCLQGLEATRIVLRDTGMKLYVSLSGTSYIQLQNNFQCLRWLILYSNLRERKKS